MAQRPHGEARPTGRTRSTACAEGHPTDEEWHRYASEAAPAPGTELAVDRATEEADAPGAAEATEGPDPGGLSTRTRWTLLATVGANLVPLAGVAFFGWDLASIMVLYSAETAVLGLASLVRLGSTTGRAAIVAVPFFMLHGGIFMLVHGVFVYALFVAPTGTGLLDRLPGLATPLLCLAVGHVVDLMRPAQEGLFPGPSGAGKVMGAFYARIVILHVTIIGTGFLLVVLGEPVVGLVLLVVLKTAFDAAFVLGRRFTRRLRRAASWSS